MNLCSIIFQVFNIDKKLPPLSENIICNNCKSESWNVTFERKDKKRILLECARCDRTLDIEIIGKAVVKAARRI